jgi:AraC family transcriptional regulator, regulatory protein of adaptative response / methylated-DNA-[protein]-cysteine methyltransferase
MRETPHGDEYWQAVMSRDRAYDQAFVFGVRSTRIYCRASCPSRHPARERVVFFDNGRDAEAAGFRACLRCRPNQSQRPELERVLAVCRLLQSCEDTPPTLETLARHVGWSRFHLQRVFSRVIGLSPATYWRSLRAGRLKQALAGAATVAAASYDAGYGSSAGLYRNAAADLGMTPAAYRRKGQGMTIRYTTVGTSLGRLLVASTTRGVCAVKLGDRDAPLEKLLRDEFAAAEVSRADRALAPAAKTIQALIDGRRPPRAVPLDIQGTAFQRLVWEALQAIPAGVTRSYRDVATAIGRPTAARAVAQACGRNPVAVLIPCHRVVQADGRLGGYHWGIARKTALLAREQRDVE